jgi:ABC-type Mn2+/Zn2+ transport system permease subunit
MVQLAATTYIFILLGMIVFQFCLIAGAPWGRMTQGGRHEASLPISGRVVAGISVVLLVFMATGVASEAKLIAGLPKWVPYTGLTIQALSALLNWITPSRIERLIWAPITTLMLTLALYVVFM